MALSLAKSALADYLGWLGGEYRVYAPVVRKGTVTFDRYRQGDEVVLDYETTNSPVKRAFFPPRETLLEFDSKGGQSTPIYDEKILVFGLHPYDVKAIEILDDAFGKPVKDTAYARRRKNSVLVAVEHGQVPNAFYSELGLDLSSGYDMMVLDEGDHYVLDPATKKGEKIVKSAHVKAKPGKVRTPRIPEAGGPRLDVEAMIRFLDRGPKEKLWEQLEKECLSCGICSYVCPICHCFDVEDVRGLAGESKRDRVWDSCMLADFAAVAGGANFRGKRSERIHNWYHHKFSRAVKERGHPDCVGCGRCITYCPAKVKIHEYMRRCSDLG